MTPNEIRVAQILYAKFTRGYQMTPAEMDAVNDLIKEADKFYINKVKSKK